MYALCPQLGLQHTILFKCSIPGRGGLPARIDQRSSSGHAVTQCARHVLADTKHSIFPTAGE